VISSAWAIGELEAFQALARLNPFRPGYEYSGTAGSSTDIVKQAQVVEQILDQVLPAWGAIVVGAFVADDWVRHREACTRAIVQLERADEIRENLGDAAPQLDASHLHPWVWEGGRSRWQSGHLADAVFAASIQVNAETQKVLGRTDGPRRICLGRRSRLTRPNRVSLACDSAETMAARPTQACIAA